MLSDDLKTFIESREERVTIIRNVDDMLRQKRYIVPETRVDRGLRDWNVQVQQQDLYVQDKQILLFGLCQPAERAMNDTGRAECSCNAS